MKLTIFKPIVASLALIASGCTANYLDINTDPYEPGKDDMMTDGYIIGAALTGMSSAVISPDVNTAQLADCLLGGTMGGYFADSNAGWANTISNYNPTDDWSRVFMASDRVIPTLYSNMKDLTKVTDDPLTLAIAEVIKVAAMHRVTDAYGPIPYTKIGEGGELQVAYDSQADVYDKFFEELDHAISVLTERRTDAISPKADYIFGGSAEKWCKFANSLKLRLAMRIVYANPDKAREMAESAVGSEVGVMTSNADNAKMTSFGEKGNPIYVSVKYNDDKTGHTCLNGGDTHAAADIICYMNGYKDPRREKFFHKSEWENTDYTGLRRGIIIPELKIAGHKYSGVNVTATSPVVWMNAAEVAFLKAEAVAVFGFNMGGTAESFYNEGIRLSFEQWGASGYEQYIKGTTKPQNYVDPYGANTYPGMLSEVTVAWDESAAQDVKQERIITQKWIANWQIGNEAWADYRRTGFPRLIPATEAGNKSNGIVDSKLGARRMPYPAVERTTNAANYQYAVSSLLKGTDNLATRMWWDCNPAIK